MLYAKKGRCYLTETIMEAYYTDDIAFLANIPSQAESLLHSLEQAAGGIGLHVNANKTEYMCFNKKKKRDISTLNSSYPEISGQVHVPQKQLKGTSIYT